MKNFRMSQKFLIAGLLMFSVSFFGCGGGGSSTMPSANGTISGMAFKGPVAGATVTAYAITNGSMGGQIGAAQTDGQGDFTMSVGDYSGAVMLQMTGGTYTDEATDTTMPMQTGDVMTSAIASVSAGESVSGIQITPLTSMAQTLAQGMTGGMTEANIVTANASVGNYFMVNNILQTTPMDPLIPGSGISVDQDMRNYGIVVAAMSQLASDVGMPFSSGMVTAMMEDSSDGIMNGMMGNSPIQMGGGMMGGMMMSSSAGTSGISAAMAQFIQSPMNRSEITLDDMQNLVNSLASSNGVIK